MQVVGMFLIPPELAQMSGYLSNQQAYLNPGYLLLLGAPAITIEASC
jgi:hypothetical protein